MTHFTYLCPMRWSDMDSFRHVNNVQFLRYLEEARIEWLWHRGEFERSHDEGVLVVRSEIDYRRQLHYRHQPVSIDLWVSRVGRSSFEVGYEVYDVQDDGERLVYAEAKTVMATVDLAEGRPKRISEQLHHYLNHHLVVHSDD